ncbi:S8 family serine peptidase [Streptomyces sp. NPDC019531]|uniref:S8 family serine peptidase n=1 Tax=Streptomyces sp. NPDC019531 TaxID=3365062 RepID=UPI00384FD91A
MAITRTMRALSATALTGALILTATPTASADQTRQDQWALDALSAQSAWQFSKGHGVTVAVIDSGVDAEHVDLKNNVLEGRDFTDGDDDPSPDAGDSEPEHGTAMASVIAGHGHGQNASDGVIGLAPEAKILPIRDRNGGFAEDIRYAVDHGASIINMSISTDQALPEDREAVAYALEHDVLIVTASGNDGKGNTVEYPKNYPGVLTVGGVDNGGAIWKGSNYGPEVLLTAPATHIVSAGWPGDTAVRSGTGTSDAAALVSAAAALLRSKFPDLTAGQIANRLVKTAALPDSEKTLSLPDEKYGYGIIQPLAALKDNIPAGSQYGPLTVPESLKAKSVTPEASTSDADQARANQKATIIWTAIGVAGLAVATLTVFLIVRRSRRDKNNNGGPGGPAAYPHHGQQTGPQQYSYQQPVSPQQNPYQQPSPPQSQWPPQQ